MGILKEIAKALPGAFVKKSVGDISTITSDTQYGGIDLLNRLTSGEWDKGKMLQQYEKSLYVFACVDMISKKIAATPFWLYQVLNSKGDTNEIMSHPAIDLMDRPNQFQDHEEFFKITAINLNLCGDAFWFKARNDRGEVAELWNLRPDFVEIIKDPELFIKAYKFNKTDGTSEIIMPEDIVHFRIPTPLDDYYGTSPIKSANIRIDTESYASQYQRDFFLNNARPDGIIKANVGASLTEEQKSEIREEFERRHKGVGKNSKLAVLEGDIAYQQVSISQREMDFIESMKFTRDDILVAFHMPKILVSITDDVNRSTSETGMNIFLAETVDPQNKSMWRKINESLISDDFEDTLFFEPEQQAKEDREAKRADYESGLKNGYLTINEVRAEENLEPVEGGDKIYLPFNMMPIGTMSDASQKSIRANYIRNKEIEAKHARMKVFRGKGLLYKKLVLKEAIINELKKEYAQESTNDHAKTLKTAKKAVGRQEKAENKATALIKAELRDQYAEMVIKSIEQRSKQLKDAMDNQAAEQKTKLLAVLDKIDINKAKSVAKRKAIGKETKDAVNTFYKGQQGVFAEFLFPFVEEYLRQSAMENMAMVNPQKTFEMTPAIKVALKTRAKQFGLGVNDTTREKISSAIAAGLEAGEGMTQISDRISEVYKEFPTWRSDLIARTEATAANNEGIIEAYKQSDVATHKEWIATKDERTRPEHAMMDGEIVAVDKNFSNGLKYPSEPNCRCVIGPAFE